MNVELIAIGTELVGVGRRDTNSEWLMRRIGELGLETVVRSAVDDNVERITELLRAALSRSGVVLTTGGLGPTEDDRTRNALAAALDRPLLRDAKRVESLRVLYERYGRRFHDELARQADRPDGAEWIENPRGSAPGILLRREGGLLAAMPGVPGEMRAMFEATVLPLLQALPGGSSIRRTLKVVGRTEASVEREIRDLYDAPGIDVTILAGIQALELHVRAEGSDDAESRSRLWTFERAVRDRLGRDLLGSEEDSLASVVGESMRSAGLTLATAESCTAGLLGAAITAVPGASGWYRGGVVVYSDALKVELVGVTPATLETHGAVSAAVARELAHGIRRRCEADVGIGITGIAGPGGGTPQKPVGLVHLALAHATDDRHWELRLIGERELIRRRASAAALDRLRRWLLARA